MKLTDSNSAKVGAIGVSAIAKSDSSTRYYHVMSGPFGYANTISATPLMWFDSQQSSTLFSDAAATTQATTGGKVARWNSRVGNYYLLQSTSAAQPTLLANQAQGKQVVSFGANNSGQFLNLYLSGSATQHSALNCTIFWVLRGSNFLLGQTGSLYDFHRGLVSGALSNTSTIWDGNYTDAAIRGGTTQLNKVSVNGTTTALTGNFDVISLATLSTGNANWNAFANDRNIANRVGGLDVAEVIIYSGQLSSSDRSTVENYLYDKYIGSSPFVISSVMGGSQNLEKTGANALVLTAANPYTGTTTIRSGELQISGSGLINNTSAITNNGTLTFVKSGPAPANANSPTIVIPAISGTGNLNATLLNSSISTTGNITGGAISIATDYISGGRGLFFPGTTSRTITGTSISLVGQVGQIANTSSSLFLNTSATNGPITLGVMNGEGGWWWGLQTITANAGTGTITIVGIINVGVVNSISTAFNFTCGAFVFSVGSGITLPVSAQLFGTGTTLTKTGTGTANLTGANTYTGATSITAGTLTVASAAFKTNTGGKCNQVTFTNTSLTANFTTAPAIGDTFAFFYGATTQTGLTVALTGTGVSGRSGTYNSATSTLTIT
jgi:autotransporter-associated beta strand protein